MRQPKVRRYIDVNGKARRLELYEERPWHLVPWHKKLPDSPVSLWRLEDGSIVQVPDDVWRYHGRKWKPVAHVVDESTV